MGWTMAVTTGCKYFTGVRCSLLVPYITMGKYSASWHTSLQTCNISFV